MVIAIFHVLEACTSLSKLEDPKMAKKRCFLPFFDGCCYLEQKVY